MQQEKDNECSSSAHNAAMNTFKDRKQRMEKKLVMISTFISTNYIFFKSILTESIRYIVHKMFQHQKVYRYLHASIYSQIRTNTYT